MGCISCYVKGKGAANKLAEHRPDVISGNVALCARCLNGAKRLKQIQEANQLVATAAEVSADIANEKAAQKAKAPEKKEATIEKKVEAQARKQQRKQR